MKYLPSFLLSATLLAAFSFPALAQSSCNKRDVVIGLLKDKYAEQSIAVGLSNDGRLLEVYSSTDGKTWSIIMTSPQGISCLVGSGQEWQRRDIPISGEDS